MEYGPTDDDRATDSWVVDYLAGEAPSADSDDEHRAELDALRALLADPRLWAEPSPQLEDAVVAAIAAEAGRTATATSVPVIGVGPAAEQLPPPVDLATAAAPTGRPTRLRRTGWRRVLAPAPLISVAAALAVVVVTGVLLFSRSNNPSTGPRFDIALAATDLAPNATGNVTLTRTTSGWRIELKATGLPRREGGRFYEAWLRNAQGVLVPIGTFNEGTDVILWSGVSPADFPLLTVTLELADGNQASSGQKVLSGTAVPA